MPPPSSKLHAVKIKDRPPLSFRQQLAGLNFFLVFNAGCLALSMQLLLLLPLRALLLVAPTPLLRRIHEEEVRWTKRCFAKLLVLMCQIFAPTDFVITLEGPKLQEEVFLEKDAQGRFVRLHLPPKIVFVSNHQIYADWWYLWCLTYMAEMDQDVIIVLKKSLKWIPLIGWGMQCFHFIFVAGSWISDRLLLARKLSRLAIRSQLRSTELSFFLYPEGTLISEQTRPRSQKFADKIGIENMRHTLLPRSTGLLYCLRSLTPHMPKLQLLDCTVAYEGIPPLHYGQDYFTLRSIFAGGVPPPRVHIHLRVFDVQRDVPIGLQSSEDVPSQHGGATKALGRQQEHAVDPSPQESEVFEQWLRKLWREKDDLLEHYLATGTFAVRPDAPARDSGVPIHNNFAVDQKDRAPCSRELVIPVRLRSNWEVLDFLSLTTVPIFYWAGWKLISRMVF